MPLALAGAAPLAVVFPSGSAESRRTRLRNLVVRILDVPPDAVSIAHEPGRPPRLASPRDAGLSLSSSSRDLLAAVAVSAGPVGVDVECVQPDAELPWRVLHPDEAAALRRLSSTDQARAFAQIWSAKEAYLKALGVGLSREPHTLAATLVGDGVLLRDDDRPETSAVVSTRWLDYDGRTYAVAACAIGVAAFRWTISLPDPQ